MRWVIPMCVLLAALPVRAETYCFGFLNAHPERAKIPADQASEIQKAHLAHMEALGTQGHLLAAGPMATQGGPRGVVIYRCQSIEQAVAWTGKDPAVVHKRLAVEMHLWEAPAGLGEPLASMIKANPAAKYTMVRLPMIVLRKSVKARAGIPAAVMKAQAVHLEMLRAKGEIRLAGPVKDSPTLAAIAVLREMKLEEGAALFDAAPLVAQGYAKVEPHMWFVAGEAIPAPAGRQP